MDIFFVCLLVLGCAGPLALGPVAGREGFDCVVGLGAVGSLGGMFHQAKFALGGRGLILVLCFCLCGVDCLSSVHVMAMWRRRYCYSAGKRYSGGKCIIEEGILLLFESNQFDRVGVPRELLAPFVTSKIQCVMLHILVPRVFRTGKQSKP